MKNEITINHPLRIGNSLMPQALGFVYAVSSIYLR
jgi:hypothetical protein